MFIVKGAVIYQEANAGSFSIQNIHRYRMEMANELKRDIGRGFIFLLVVVMSLIIMSALGVWYRQVILQSFLSDRIIQQRAAFIECRSLLPVLRVMTAQLTDEDLKREDKAFLLIKDEEQLRWTIVRSALAGEKLVFEFNPGTHYSRSVRFTVKAKND